MDKYKLWSIELLKFYYTKDINEIKNRLQNISDTLIFLHEILAENKVELEQKDAYSEQLVIKIHLQNLSILKISEGYRLESEYFNPPKNDIKFLDLSSIITINRSQYESLLMYQHLYVNSQNTNEQKLRFESWIMSSMMQRRKIFSDSQDNIDEQRIINEAETIESFKKSISENPAFKNLTEKQQEKLLEIGTGKLFKNWDLIMKESKFAENGIFSKIYFLASVYAHSEGLLALQLKETKHLLNNAQMQNLLFMFLYSSYIISNVMIMNIVNKFDLVKKRFESLDEKKQFEIKFNFELAYK